MTDGSIEEALNSAIDTAISTIPAHVAQVEQNEDLFQVENPKEFAFGMVFGMAVSMCGMLLSEQSVDDVMDGRADEKIMRVVEGRIPDIRARIFGGDDGGAGPAS